MAAIFNIWKKHFTRHWFKNLLNAWSIISYINWLAILVETCGALKSKSYKTNNTTRSYIQLCSSIVCSRVGVSLSKLLEMVPLQLATPLEETPVFCSGHNHVLSCSRMNQYQSVPQEIPCVVIQLSDSQSDGPSHSPGPATAYCSKHNRGVMVRSKPNFNNRGQPS